MSFRTVVASSVGVAGCWQVSSEDIRFQRKSLVGHLSRIPVGPSDRHPFRAEPALSRCATFRSTAHTSSWHRRLLLAGGKRAARRGFVSGTGRNQHRQIATASVARRPTTKPRANHRPLASPRAARHGAGRRRRQARPVHVRGGGRSDTASIGLSSTPALSVVTLRRGTAQNCNAVVAVVNRPPVA